MNRTKLSYLPVLAISIVVLFGAGTLHAQTPNAWGYTTGYGNVYGTFGLAQTMQTMYNATRRHTQTTSSLSSTSSKPVTQSNSQRAVPPPSVVRNYGAFRPDKTVDTGKPFSDALGETTEEKALILKIYTATKTGYEKEAAAKGWSNNIAGGLTFFTIVAINVYRDGQEPSDEGIETYCKAVNASLDEIPEFASVTNKDKQNFNNMLIGFSGLMLAAYTEGKQNGDAATLDGSKKLAGMLINMVLKTDPENLRIENGQIVLK